ncbi:MAG: hypothetical protein JO275_03775 [Verrucomicrobia bacterium]|nr:hypothetical protein [Verrucomicrobiota bacterium]
MNSIWYFLEYQRQSSATDSQAEMSVSPQLRARISVKGGLIELGVPFFVLAVLVTFGVVCFLCPTFLS